MYECVSHIAPDLPGCFSAGATIAQAIELAKEAIELHLQGLIEEGQAMRPARSIEEHRRNPDYAGATWAIVTIDPSRLPARARRINITMPEGVLKIVDRYADQHGETRSGLLVRAVTEYIAKK